MPRNDYGWKDVVEFFSEFEKGHVVSRTEMLCSLGLENSFHQKLADEYRCYLSRAGYLTSAGRGLYKIKKIIPIDLGQRECRRQAYPHLKE